ncbi:MAG: LytR C-terminal domain-containing protein [Elusimicrobiota bacterium]
MEQAVRKKQLIILAAGGLITFSLMVAHYLSPISRRLSSNSKVELVMLNKEHPMLFIYNSFSKTVDAVKLPGKSARGGSAYQRASDVLKDFSRNGASEPAYIEVQSPDMAAFEYMINNWRACPASLSPLVRYLRELRQNDATNLSMHDIALLTLELARMNSSNFVKEEFNKARSSDAALAAETAAETPDAPAVLRLEVMNASGRKDLAGAVTKFLRDKGFDVINFGTYGSIETQTKIVNCSDNIKAAHAVREALDLGGLEIYSKFDKRAIAQIKIILGADFDYSKMEKINRGMR